MGGWEEEEEEWSGSWLGAGLFHFNFYLLCYAAVLLYLTYYLTYLTLIFDLITFYLFDLFRLLPLQSCH